MNNEAIFWIIFNISILTLLVLDLFVFNKGNKVVTTKSALVWSAFWVGLALAFNIFVYIWRGQEAAELFFTGYVIEESLSVDNLFVFMLIFSYFRVPAEYQRKVLFWGIIGALILRGLFIVLGIELIQRFDWLLYVLGFFLMYTGIKMLFSSDDEEIDPENNIILKLTNKFIRVTKTYEEDKFFIRKEGILYATPLFIVVLIVESTDVVFAVDSIPTILGITTDTFIVYTSNVFALLGLRSLYFALSSVMKLFHYINYGLAVILSFVGVKLLIHHWYEINHQFALLFVVSTLAISILASWLFPKKNNEELDF
ncbi:TerC family protein [Cytophaga aurantiaca]|uniref:TerC family protein n=1 Tax=Cytophaga aurantiaca TaxID=29530 RepID=UPI00037E0370|nr:TerC family protein [Cytophaga aurantiaca]